MCAVGGNCDFEGPEEPFSTLYIPSLLLKCHHEMEFHSFNSYYI